MTKNCLNCNTETNSNFCPNCGQKSSVHQYSVKHFIEYDLVHGILHVDSGILFTLKELFTKPGHAVREFIYGKRVKLFNFISLLVIIIAVSHFIGSYSSFKLADIMPESSENFATDYESITKKYPKLILLLTIPFYSIITFFWFKKAKLNLTEHFVLNSYRTAGELLILFLFTLITLIYTDISGLKVIYSVITTGAFIYSFWFYYQFFSTYGYSKSSLIFKSILSLLSYLLVGILAPIFIVIFKLVYQNI